jgi:hypothetical protein
MHSNIIITPELTAKLVMSIPYQMAKTQAVSNVEAVISVNFVLLPTVTEG